MLKTGRKYAACALLLLVFTLLLQIKIPFLYTVNDDLFMKNIVSGAYLGTPDTHAVYMEYPVCLLLTGLYRLAAGIPWYGILFFIFHIAAWSAILGRLLDRRTAKAALLLLLVFVPTGFYHIASMQFTVTAAVLGAAALVWLETADVSLSPRLFLKDQLVTALFVFLSFNVRRNVLLLFVPMAGMLWLGRLFEKRGDVDRRLGALLGAAGLCATGAAVCLVSYRAAYGTPEWQDYIRYNDNATVLYDYSGWPDYAENQKLYEELGISREGWYGAQSAYLLAVDSGIDADAMETLAQRSQELAASAETMLPKRLTAALCVCAQRMVSDTDRPLNLIVLSLYGAVLAGLLLGQNRAGLFRLSLFFTGRMFSWLYVVLEGRYPTRITQSLLLAECTVLLAFLIRDAAAGYIRLWSRPGKTKICKLAVAGAAGGYLVLLGILGAARVRHVYTENTARLAQSAGLQEVKEYCASHADRFYFVDTRSISSGTERIFDGAQSAYENYTVFGGWLSDSPVYRKKKADRGAADTERALLENAGVHVIFEQSENCPTAYLTDYFQSGYENFRMDRMETFGGGDGGRFAVYRLGADAKRGSGG